LHHVCSPGTLPTIIHHHYRHIHGFVIRRFAILSLLLLSTAAVHLGGHSFASAILYPSFSCSRISTPRSIAGSSIGAPPWTTPIFAEIYLQHSILPTLPCQSIACRSDLTRRLDAKQPRQLASFLSSKLPSLEPTSVAASPAVLLSDWRASWTMRRLRPRT
jgi:hypothetical protein